MAIMHDLGILETVISSKRRIGSKDTADALQRIHDRTGIPDMLAALRVALDVLVQDDTPMAYAQVRNAIAKAEGKTNG